MEPNISSSGSDRVSKNRVLLPMTALQKKFYRMALTHNFQTLIDAGLSKYLPNTSDISPLLQKICIHPFLVPVFEEYLTMNQTPEKINELLFSSTPRYEYIIKVLEKCKEEKKRLAVVCSRNEALDLLATAIEFKGYDTIIVNSKVTAAQRQGQIDKFNSSTDSTLIISSKLAPSFEINADKVIIHDLLASDKELLSGDYRFITAPKVEVECLLLEHSYEQIAFEKMLGEANLWPELGSVPNQAQNPDYINQLLKFGAYETFKEENIDQILASRSPQPEVANSPFQKATFVVSTEESQIDIDDPNFWEKILPTTASNEQNKTDEQPDTRRYNTRSKNK